MKYIKYWEEGRFLSETRSSGYKMLHSCTDWPAPTLLTNFIEMSINRPDAASKAQHRRLYLCVWLGHNLEVTGPWKEYLKARGFYETDFLTLLSKQVNLNVCYLTISIFSDGYKEGGPTMGFLVPAVLHQINQAVFKNAQQCCFWELRRNVFVV